MTTKHTAWAVFAILLSVGGVWTLSLKPVPGPANPETARDLIQGVVPASWKVITPTEQQTEMTKEYFPDGPVKTLALVGPQIDHLRWTDHQGNVHVEDWGQECLLLWIIPAYYRPKFPNFFDHMASGANLPTLIFSLKNVRVYGYVTNSGFDIDRFRKMDKEIAMFFIDGVNPSWSNWARDIEHQLATVGGTNGSL